VRDNEFWVLGSACCFRPLDPYLGIDTGAPCGLRIGKVGGHKG